MHPRLIVLGGRNYHELSDYELHMGKHCRSLFTKSHLNVFTVLQLLQLVAPKFNYHKATCIFSYEIRNFFDVLTILI